MRLWTRLKCEAVCNSPTFAIATYFGLCFAELWIAAAIYGLALAWSMHVVMRRYS